MGACFSATEAQINEDHDMDVLSSDIDAAVGMASNITLDSTDYSEYTDVNARFSIVKMLGHGVSCKVMQVIDNKPTTIAGAVSPTKSKLRQNPHYALKEIPKSNYFGVECFRNEVKILLKLKSHPHIVKLIDYFEDEANLYILTQLCTGGDLLNRLKLYQHFSELTASQTLKPIFQTLKDLHSMNIVHRDLKPANLMLDVAGPLSHLVLIDFGTAIRIIPETIYQDAVGTPLFVDPQYHIKGGQLSGTELKAWDIWSLGVIAYIMVVGCPPFKATNENEVVFESTRMRQLKFPKNCQLSPNCRSFLSGLLRVDNTQRFTAEQALLHPWIAYPESKSSDIHLGEVWRHAMGDFVRMNRLMKIIVDNLISNLSAEETEMLMKVFQQLDTTNKGFLERSQIENWIRSSNPQLTQRACQKRVNDIMSLCSDDINSGKVYLHKFMRAQASMSVINNPNKALHQSLGSLGDICGDSKLNTKLFHAALEKRYSSEIAEDAAQMMQDLEPTLSGRVSVNKFVRVLAVPALQEDSSMTPELDQCCLSIGRGVRLLKSPPPEIGQRSKTNSSTNETDFLERALEGISEHSSNLTLLADNPLSNSIVL